jgi:hypothetical protein
MMARRLAFGCLCTIALPWHLVQVAAVPVFTIDLDLPPEKRWVEVTKNYKEELLAMRKAIDPLMAESPDVESWGDIVDKTYDPNLKAEMVGIARTLGRPTHGAEFKKFLLGSAMYELGSPTSKLATPSCSAALWAAPNGTVLHGRNLDYSFPFKMPSGEVKNWKDVTFDAIFYRSKKPLMRATMFPGSVGFATAMRYDGWAFQQNTRNGFTDGSENLKAAHQGGKLFTNEARLVMEKTPDYKTAVNKLWEAKLMAPSYFVLSGPGAYEGTVMAMDRMGQHLSSSQPPIKLSDSRSAWHLLQANDDQNQENPAAYTSSDPRRPIANTLLEGVTQDAVNEENLEKFMHAPLLNNAETVYSTLMCVRTGHYKTILPDEAPSPQEALHALEEGFGTLTEKRGRTHGLRQRKLFLKATAKLSADLEQKGVKGKYFENVYRPTKALKRDFEIVKSFSQPRKTNLRHDSHESGSVGLTSFPFLIIALCFRLL